MRPVLELLLSLLWFVLMTTALLSLYSSFLGRLAAHGKLRASVTPNDDESDEEEPGDGRDRANGELDARGGHNDGGSTNNRTGAEEVQRKGRVGRSDDCGDCATARPRHAYQQQQCREKEKANALSAAIDNIVSLTVPKRFFSHFYLIGFLFHTWMVVSVLLMQFTGRQATATAATMPAVISGRNDGAAFADSSDIYNSGAVHDRLSVYIHVYNTNFSPVYYLQSARLYLDSVVRHSAPSPDLAVTLAPAAGVLVATETPTYSVVPVVDSILLFSLFYLQLLRRLIESLCVTQHSATARMHILGYVLGVGHYVLVSLSLLADSPFTCTHTQTYARMSESGYSGLALFRQACACLLFVYASYHQYVSHLILARLRAPSATRASAVHTATGEGGERCVERGDDDYHRDGGGCSGDANVSGVSDLCSDQLRQNAAKKKKEGGRNVYKIPKGGWFRYVSSPHYLCEILLYFSFALLSPPFSSPSSLTSISASSFLFSLPMRAVFSLPSFFPSPFSPEACISHVHKLIVRLSVCALGLYELIGVRITWFIFLWVFVNITVSALSTHAWYKATFVRTYPCERKAVIPFVL